MKETLKYFRLTSLLILSVLIFSCKEEENTTAFSGQVIDIDTNLPVADAKVELTLADGVTSGNNTVSPTIFVNPEFKTTKTDESGNYNFIVSTNDSKQVFKSTTSKKGYTTRFHDAIPIVLGSLIKHNEKNTYDLKIAKASYLRLNIRKQTAAQLKSVATKGLSDEYGFPRGAMFMNDKINLSPGTKDTTITRDYYFKNNSKVRVDYEILGGDGSNNSSKTIELVEHDTVEFDINY